MSDKEPLNPTTKAVWQLGGGPVVWAGVEYELPENMTYRNRPTTSNRDKVLGLHTLMDGFDICMFLIPTASLVAENQFIITNTTKPTKTN